MELALDPTFLMTRRGMTWLERAAVQGLQMVTSATALEQLRSYGLERLHRYRYGGRGFWWTPNPDPYGLSGITETLALERQDVAGRHDDLSYHVAEELLACLERGARLVARRPSTLDLLVQSGVTVEFRAFGHDGVHLLRLSALPGLSSELWEALRRRCRYFVVLTDYSSSPNSFDGRVLALDAGPYGTGAWR